MWAPPGAGSPQGWPEGAEARMGQVNRCGLIPDVEKGARQWKGNTKLGGW